MRGQSYSSGEEWAARTRLTIDELPERRRPAALALWIGLPVVPLVESVISENVSAALATMYAGDWLLKLLIVTVIVTL